MATRRLSAQGGLVRYGDVAGLPLRYAEFLRAFITYHAETGRWNATAAARAVGYNVKNAKLEGHRILALPAVQEAWQAHIQRTGLAADIPVDERQVEHLKDVHAIAHSQITDVIEYDGDGRELRVYPSDQWSDRARRAVKMVRQKEVIKTYEKDGLTETTRTLEIEFHDKAAMLRLEAQELGTIKGGTLRVPGLGEFEDTGGGFQFYQVNHFRIPDNGRGPKPVGAGPTGE